MYGAATPLPIHYYVVVLKEARSLLTENGVGNQ
jgi:hypothetical protein